MNAALSEGLRPLVKKVEATGELQRTCSLIQNKATGEVRRLGLDVTWADYDATEWAIVVTDFALNESPKSPVAAYLIPRDLRIGERVVLEDVIEEIVSGRYSGRAGCRAFRLESAAAVSIGVDFILDERYRAAFQMIG